jgi:hypothetical protein
VIAGKPTYYKHKHTVSVMLQFKLFYQSHRWAEVMRLLVCLQGWVNPGPPGPPGLTCATAENCTYVQVQNELLSALLFQSIDQARR